MKTSAEMRILDDMAEAKSLGIHARPRRRRDITGEFIAASQRLRPGQLVKDEHFELFEAVAALEIMDSKMDSGFVPPGDTFDLDFNVSSSLEADRVAWIMDQIMCLEMIWHDGYPLSQTVFTSLHIDHLLDPSNQSSHGLSNDLFGKQQVTSFESELVSNVLQAYCIAVVKCCQLVLQIIQSQTYYEEEDFVTNLFGRELLPDVDVSHSMTLLESAIAWLIHCGHGEEPLVTGILDRLRFRLMYLRCLANSVDGWEELVTTLDRINVSHAQTKALPEAFSDKVQRRLAMSAPPRPMLSITWSEALQKWQSMCSDIVNAHRLTSPWICQSPHALQRAIWAFAYRTPSPNTFARAWMQELLFGNGRFPDDGAYFDLFLTDIRDLVLTGDVLADPHSFQVEQPSDPRHLCSRIIETFMERAFQEYLNLYRMACQNRCRMRRTFTQALPLLDEIESVARESDEMIDQILNKTIPQRDKHNVDCNPRPLTTWVQCHKFQSVIWTIQLGVETEIYLDEEYSLIYWLVHYFSQARVNALEGAVSLLQTRRHAAAQARQRHHQIEFDEAAEWLQCLLSSAQITGLLSNALWTLYATLDKAGILQSRRRKPHFVGLPLFDTRIKPFVEMHNGPVPTHDDFQLAAQQVPDADQACDDVLEKVKAAKSLITSLKDKTGQQAKHIGTEVDWSRELKALETTCVALSVQVLRFKQLRKENDGPRAGIVVGRTDQINLTIARSQDMHHPWWIVPRITAKVGDKNTCMTDSKDAKS